MRITSNGVSFKVVDFPGGTKVRVGPDLMAAGQGNELGLDRSIGLEFQLPAGVQEAVYLFRDYFGVSTGLVMNGIASAKGLGFGPIAGTPLSGL